jgi:protein arginine N-methyltransferase 5
LNLSDVTDGWEVWDSLRHLTGHNNRLFCCLELSEDLPDDLNELKRWAAEPLKAIIIPTRIFLENKKGYPVLSKQHQAALSILLQFKMHIIFSGRPTFQDSLTPYIQYIQHLRSRDVSLLSEGEKFTFSYKDTLQSPLQPLMDNLESQTYETFERDPVKYERYEAAIAKALIDASDSRKVIDNKMMITSESDADDGDIIPIGVAERIIVTVVGAGRGPLVACALSASSSTGVPIKIYAVEKNMNAVITLRNRVLTELWSNVTVIAGDMRSSQPIEQADILVSELLGSWGDNELSPECLDGAQSFLKTGGLSIPSSYTSFVAPMSSSKLWMAARGQVRVRVRIEVLGLYFWLMLG